MPAVVDVKVSDSFEPPEGSHWVRLERPGMGCPLWVRNGEEGPWVTDLKLLYGSKEGPEGYIPAGDDLNPKGSKRVYLWMQKSKDSKECDPIFDVRLMEASEYFAPAGFVKFSQSLNPGTTSEKVPKLFLAIKTLGQHRRHEARKWVVGDKVDCKDTMQSWLVAEIIEIREKPHGEDEIKIHYVGWPSRWDEWIERTSDRVSPLATYTKGKYTGQLGPPWNLDEHVDELREVVETLQNLKAEQEKLDSKGFTPENIHYLTQGENRDMMTQILMADMEDVDELVPLVQQYLQCNLSLIIQTLKPGTVCHPELVEGLVHIFSTENKFYQYGATGKEKAQGACKFAKMPPQSFFVSVGVGAAPKVSVYLVDNINFFGDNGGFDYVEKRLAPPPVVVAAASKKEDKGEAIKQGEPPMVKQGDKQGEAAVASTDSFTTVSALLKTLAIIKERVPLQKKFLEKYVKQLDLQGLCGRTLKGLTDQELKSRDQHALNSFLEDVKTILRGYTKEKDLDEFLERSQLDIALRLLFSTVLREQITALNTLASVIRAVTMASHPEIAKKEEEEAAKRQKDMASRTWIRQGRYAQGEPAPPPPVKAKFLKPEILVEWISKNQLVKRLLDKANHEQIVKESTPILKFLALHNALTVEHIDLLWNTLASGHGSLRRIIYDTLAEITEDLEEAQVDILYERVKTLPISEYQDFNLQFLRDFTINAVKATQGRKKWYGLDQFWIIVQDQNAASLDKDVSSMAFQCLEEILCNSLFESQRERFLNMAVKGLQENQSVVQCLKLIKTVMMTFESPDVAILKYNKQFDLLDALLTNLDAYSKTALAAQKRMLEKKRGLTKMEAALASKDGLVLVPPHPHRLQLNARLSFLEDILSHSSLSLSQAQLATLWKVLVSNAISPADTALLLNFLTRGVQGARKKKESAAVADKDDAKASADVVFETFSADIAKFVFEEFLCQSKPADLTPLWYQCFQDYFLELNLQQGAITTANPKWLMVKDYDKLLGMEALWLYSIETEDPKVSRMARDFLVTTNLRLDNSYDSDKKRKIFSSFMLKCIKKLEVMHDTVLQDPSNEKPKGPLTAIVDLLASFLTRIDSGEAWRRPLFSVGEPVFAYWKNQNTKTKYEGKVMRINEDQTYFVLFSDGDQDLECKESNLFDEQKRPKVAIMTEQDQEDQTYPKLFLSKNDSAFALFFDLLGVGGATANRMWELLQFLPKNSGMQDRVHSLGTSESVEWEKVLPSDSPPKLLYTLEIVEESLKPNPDVPTENEQEEGKSKKVQARYNAIQAFRNMFVAKGGLKYLLLYVITQPQEQLLGQKLPKKCLRLVLSILKLFYVDDADVDMASILEDVDKPATAQRLFQLLATYGSLSTDPAALNPSDPEDLERVHAQLVEYTFSLLIKLSLTSKALSTSVLQFPEWPQILEKGFRNPSYMFCKALHDGIVDYCERADEMEQAMRSKEADPRHLFLPLLVKQVISIGNQKEASSTSEVSDAELLGTLRDVLRKIPKEELNDDGQIDAKVLGTDAKVLATTLSSLIQTHPIRETNEKTVDLTLVAMYGLAAEMIRLVKNVNVHLMGKKTGGPPSLVQEVMDGLFKFPALEEYGTSKHQPPKAKSEDARKAAFDLLQQLCYKNPSNCSLVASLLESNHRTGPQGSSFDSDIWEHEASDAKILTKNRTVPYVGLRNLGCICYMNASMQQLFMIPQLRRNLLSIDQYTYPDKLKEDNVFQLQYIMAHLQESEKEYVNPKPWTDIWMDETGKTPINVGRQEDASAYVIKCIDRIGDMVKKSPYEHAFSDVMGGLYEHQLIGRDGCPHSKISRDEEFFTIPVEVKNMKTLEDSLKAFVEGEDIEGYNCEECKTKVRVQKRAVVKKLPPTLCITLKRFVLNFETFNTEKLDDKIEFPYVLDMLPYTADALPLPSASGAEDDLKGDGVESKSVEPSPAKTPMSRQTSQSLDDSLPPDLSRQNSTESVVGPPPEHYKYRLKGIVIHTGSANSGHYYSFIQERLMTEEGKSVPGNWYKFNDTFVSEWDPASIPSECFGGGKGEKGFGGTANGYLLFYDRLDLEHPETAKVTQGHQAIANLSDLVPEQTTRARFKVPSRIFQDIYEQTRVQWQDRAIFSQPYFAFVYDFIKVIAQGTKNDDVKSIDEVDLNKPCCVYDAVTRMATQFFLATLSRSKSKKQYLPSFLGTLRTLYQNNLSSSCWLLNQLGTTEKRLVLTYLLRAPEVQVRQAFEAIFKEALSTVAPHEKASWSLPLPDPPEKKGEVDEDVPHSAVEKKADSRGYCIGALRQLFRFLSVVPNHWRYFNEFFGVLGHATTLGPEVVPYLQAEELLAKLLDIYLGEYSPDPHFLGIPLDRTGKRAPMIDPRTNHVPEMLNLWVIVLNLLQLTPFNELSDQAKKFLRHEIFYLITHFEARDNADRGKITKEIYMLLCLNDEECLTRLCAQLPRLTKDLNYQQMRPLWRVLDALLGAKQGDQKARTVMIMSSMYEGLMMQVTKRPKMRGTASIKMFDFCIEMTLRAAKKHPLVFQWLADSNQANVMEFCLRFCASPAEMCLMTQHDVAPRFMPYTVEPSYRSMVKEYFFVKQYTFTTSSKHAPHGASFQEKIAQLNTIRAGNYDALERPMEGYDSDDERRKRVFKAGDEIDVLDSERHWLAAHVVRVITPPSQNMSQQIEIDYRGFRQKEWAEIMFSCSARIAPIGTLSSLEPKSRY
eukprot:gb/GEZN01000063.1/.p1 GENE.gb/GEZN01000063.1/~~gb/GEZN01000063.1/.p1  ORF type:complete len:2729 (+),score=457.52 gb/GEZN01000063.1/:65-8188(+)